jgi:hypothetical protein
MISPARMMFRFPHLATLTILLTAATRPDVVLKGTAKDCFRRTYVQVAGVTIGAFDVSGNREIVELLTAMDTAAFADNDTSAMTRQEIRYARLVDLAARSSALARATTDTTGSFTLHIAAVDSVLVFGYAESEDEMLYYSYRIVGGRASSSFYLDMSGGQCRYPDEAHLRMHHGTRFSTTASP